MQYRDRKCKCSNEAAQRIKRANKAVQADHKLEFGLYSMLYMPRLSVRANI
jgi:hypothetical protein